MSTTPRCRRIACLALILSAPLLAQTAPDCSNPSILLSGINRKGEALAGLQASDLKVQVKGQDATAASVKPYTGPKRLLILIDASRNMTFEPESGPWQLAATLVKDAIKNASPRTSVAIAFYASGVDHYSGFPSDRDDLVWLFDHTDPDKVFPGHKYNAQLFDALNWALDALAPTQPGDSIYLITTGNDNLSHASFEQTRDHLIRSRVRLFSYLLRPYLPQPISPLYVPGALPVSSPRVGLFEPVATYVPVVDLARDSGGNIAVENANRYGFVRPGPEKQALIFEAAFTLYRQMQTPMELTLALPDGVTQPGKTRVSLRPSEKSAGALEGWQLHYPAFLAGCEAPPRK